jgi:formate hydrogenlyase subunit 3/multisubunit Na+/H+ antiporter MnhD subunit
MKIKYLISVLVIFIAQTAIACPVCEKQQPKITQGLTHGAGPQSNWDWVIIAIISLITVFSLIYSIKYLLKPGEKNNDHIKQSILIN